MVSGPEILPTVRTTVTDRSSTDAFKKPVAESPAGKSKPVAETNRKHFFKTELCRFFPRCTKGNECPFAHSLTELQDQPDLTKTALCTAWRRGRCPLESGECKFAHGAWELREPAAEVRARRRQRPARPMGPGALQGSPTKPGLTDLKERLTEQTSATAGTRTPSGSETPSDCETGWFSETIVPGDFGRQMSCGLPDLPDFFEGISRQVSTMSMPDMQRQVTPLSAMAPTPTFAKVMSPTHQMANQNQQQSGLTIQMPVLINMGAVQMPMLASITNMTPEAMSQMKVQIESVLREAQPAQYED